MRRTWLPVTWVVVLASVMAAPLTSAAGTEAPPFHIDREEDCLELRPVATSVGSVTDDGTLLSLDVLVLLDELEFARGKEVMTKAAEAYEPLGISLDVRFEHVAFAPEEEGEGDDPVPSSTSKRLLADAKKWTLGARPADVDLVYVLTGKNISNLLGQADCAGGVRYPKRAFAVGENTTEDIAGIFWRNGTAKIAAHEIGHLMGAHHHYANCVEGTPKAVEETDPTTPCSLMFNYVDFQALRFGTLEGAVVRGHTLEFASQGPDVGSIFSSAVDLKITGGKVSGTISSAQAGCRQRAEVRIQRYASEKEYDQQGWVDVRTGLAHRGTFSVKMPIMSGEFRAFVPETNIQNGGKKAITCAQAASAPVRIDP